MSKPIGLAEYRLTEALPDEIKTNIPTIEQLEAELSKSVDEAPKKYKLTIKRID